MGLGDYDEQEHERRAELVSVDDEDEVADVGHEEHEISDDTDASTDELLDQLQEMKDGEDEEE